MSPIADNVGYSAGVGTSIATDDISSVHYQKVKVTIGGSDKAHDLQPVTASGVTASTTDTTIASSSGIFFGFMCFSTEAAGVGQIHIRDSTSGSTGTFLAGARLSTGATDRDRSLWCGPQGVKFTSGLRIVLPSTVTANVTAFFISPA